MSTEFKSEEDKASIESEIVRTKIALRPRNLLVIEPKRDYSKNPGLYEVWGSGEGRTILIRCFYLVTKLFWLYTKRPFLKITHRTRHSSKGVES